MLQNDTNPSWHLCCICQNHTDVWCVGPSQVAATLHNQANGLNSSYISSQFKLDTYIWFGDLCSSFHLLQWEFKHLTLVLMPTHVDACSHLSKTSKEKTKNKKTQTQTKPNQPTNRKKKKNGDNSGLQKLKNLLFGTQSIRQQRVSQFSRNCMTVPSSVSNLLSEMSFNAASFCFWENNLSLSPNPPFKHHFVFITKTNKIKTTTTTKKPNKKTQHQPFTIGFHSCCPK